MSADIPGDEALDRIREYRRAARAIVGAEQATVQRRCLGLLELGEAARSELDPLVRVWSERAIWEECRGFLGVEDRVSIAPPASYESAQRKLRGRGLTQCPTCRADLATDLDLERWGRMRVADAEHRDAREGAVNG